MSHFFSDALFHILMGQPLKGLGVQMRFDPIDKNVRIIGRTKSCNKILYLSYSCSAIEFKFEGTKAEVVIQSQFVEGDSSHRAWLAVVLNTDTEPIKRFNPHPGTHTYTLYEGTEKRSVIIRLVKMSEAAFDKVGIEAIITDNDIPIIPTQEMERKIEFIGDSITCGYGVEGLNEIDLFDTIQENPWKAYAARTARILKAEYHLVSWSGIGIISSWIPEDEDKPLEEPLMPDLYQYTDKALDQAMGLSDYEKWDTNKFVPDCIVVNLGTNDMSYTRGMKDRIDTFGKAYADFIKDIRDKNPYASILCVLGVMGQELFPEIESQISRLRSKDENIYSHQLKLQLEADGIGTEGHPSLRTHEKLAEDLSNTIRKIMNWNQ